MWSISCGPLIGSPARPNRRSSGPSWLSAVEVELAATEAETGSAAAAVAEVDVDGWRRPRRPVDRGLLDEADLLRLFGREALLDHLVGTSGTGSLRRDRLSLCGTGIAKIASSCLTSRLWSSSRQRLALERLGVRRQQLAEELLLRRLGPADQLHALVEVLHQRRQLHQELLAERRRALGLHAHHQVGADPPVAPRRDRSRRRRAAPPAPAPGSRPAARNSRR